MLILHLSNRNLEINGPGPGAGKACCRRRALIQHYLSRYRPQRSGAGWPSTEWTGDRTGSQVAGFRALSPTCAGRSPSPIKCRPWTDDYTNLFGAFWRRLKAENGPQQRGLGSGWAFRRTPPPWAIRPSSLPVKPMPSVVVAFIGLTLFDRTGREARPRCSAQASHGPILVVDRTVVGRRSHLSRPWPVPMPTAWSRN